jgi:hypothetical protein
MTDYLNQLKQWQYFPELAFVAAVLLILMAWKFAIEGIVESAVE